MEYMGTKEAAESGVIRKVLFQNGVEKERFILW